MSIENGSTTWAQETRERMSVLVAPPMMGGMNQGTGV